METKILDYKGCKIHYFRRVENNAKNWIIFLHGAGVDHHMFDEQIYTISNEYNILAIDSRGHGASIPNKIKFSFEQLVDDTLEILKKESIKSAIFIGQSMGGNLAQEIAYRHPEMITGLVLIDCTNNNSKLTTSEKFILSISKPIFMLYPEKTLIKQSAKACSNKDNVREYIEKCFYKIGKKDLVEILMQLFECLHEDNSYKISKKFLLLCGEHDKLGNIYKSSEKWANNNKNCIYHIIPDAYHNANQDQPEIVNELINKYLNEIDY